MWSPDGLVRRGPLLTPLTMYRLAIPSDREQMCRQSSTRRHPWRGAGATGTSIFGYRTKSRTFEHLLPEHAQGATLPCRPCRSPCAFAWTAPECAQCDVGTPKIGRPFEGVLGPRSSIFAEYRAPSRRLSGQSRATLGRCLGHVWAMFGRPSADLRPSFGRLCGGLGQVRATLDDCLPTSPL